MRRKILASLLSLSLLAALCVGTAFAEATPKIIWLPEGVQAERNMEIDELDACISGTAICAVWWTEPERPSLHSLRLRMASFIPFQMNWFAAPQMKKIF